MATAGLIFTLDEANEAAKSLKDHVKSFMWLSAFFFAQRKCLFKLRCKTHYLFHVSDDIKELCLNPSMWENFDEESWLGKFKRIGLKCHGGTCTSKIFMRYLLYLTVQLREFNKTANLNEWLEGFVLECIFSHDFSKVINETWYRNGRSFCCGGPFGDKPRLRIGTTCEVKNVFSSHRLPSLQGLMGMLNETSSAV